MNESCFVFSCFCDIYSDNHNIMSLHNALCSGRLFLFIYMKWFDPLLAGAFKFVEEFEVSVKGTTEEVKSLCV